MTSLMKTHDHKVIATQIKKNEGNSMYNVQLVRQWLQPYVDFRKVGVPEPESKEFLPKRPKSIARVSSAMWKKLSGS